MSTFDELLGVLARPSTVAPVSIDWSRIEDAVGTRLPSDYKTYIESYGAGSIDDFLWVFHPTVENRHLQLIPQVMARLDSLRALRNEVVPFRLFPAPGGLLPWGATDNGDVCYWITQGAEPDRWSVVVNESRGPRWPQFDGTMSEFLRDVLSGRYRCPVFPTDFPSGSPAFVPFGGSDQMGSTSRS